MPSKLRKAIGAVKDQTSISLAKVTNAANLEVTILKATTHDKGPIDERYVNEIVQLVSSNKVYAAACAQCIGKRIGKTRNWVVALKSLIIVLRIFQDGDPYFPREVFHAMKRGAKILNLSSFRDDSSYTSPWDYTAFVRTFALYLDERLDCFLTGKLQRRFTYHNHHHHRSHEKNQRNNKLLVISNDEPGIKDMKPNMILDRITYWQKLLDRAIGTRPTGSAKTNRLVQISLYALVQESFDLYRDISDGLAVVLDSFFHLPYPACVAAFRACDKSYKQFDELSAFYSFCANIGVGRSYEYPTVQKVSEELMETLREFLKDQASFPGAAAAANSSSGSRHSVVFPTPKNGRHHHHAGSSSSQDEGSERYGTVERYFGSGSGSDFGSQCTSLEDLMSATDAAMSSRRSSLEEEDMYSEQSSEEEEEDDDELQSQQSVDDEFASANDSGSTKSFPADQASRSSLDIISFDDFQQEVQQQQQNQTNELGQQNTTKPGSGNNNGSKDCWELVLAKTVAAPTETSPPKLAIGYDSFLNLFDQPSVPQQQYNPFLEDTGTNVTPPPPPATSSPILLSQVSFIDDFDVAPMFKSMEPTFRAQDPLALTFADQSSFSTTNLDLILCDINPNEAPTLSAPSFRAQHSSETTMTVPQTSHNTTCTEMIVAPSFRAQFSFQNIDTATNFHMDNSYETSIAPTFSVQNFNSTTEELIHASHHENLNLSMVPVAFQQHNFHHSIVAPTFSAKDCSETTLATPKEDDPFEPWSGAKTNERASYLSNQDQILFQQQQLWLEQQNKIMAKYMT